MLRGPLPTASTSNRYRQQYYAPSLHRMMSHSDEPASRLACQFVEQTAVITVPPYEWPMRMVGLLTRPSARVTVATSPLRVSRLF